MELESGNASGMDSIWHYLDLGVVRPEAREGSLIGIGIHWHWHWRGIDIPFGIDTGVGIGYSRGTGTLM